MRKCCLLDPFEEQFHLPAGLVEAGNGQRGQFKVIGQEDEEALVFGIEEADPAQRRRIMFQ